MLIDDEQQEGNSLILRNEDSNQQPDFYQQLQNINSDNDYFEETKKNLKLQLSKNEEQHKQHMIQLETVGMMSKYQLVFTKMEAAINRVSSLLKAKDVLYRHQGFYAIKNTTIDNIKKIAINSKIYEKNFKKKLTKLANLLQNKTINQQQKSFKKILIAAVLKKLELKQREEQEQRKRDCVNKLTLKDEEIEKAKKKNEDLDAAYWQSKSLENELQQKIQTKQRQIQKLENELIDVKKITQQPVSSSNKHTNSTVQDSKLKDLENNNALLSVQLSQNQNSLMVFIREMNELLDSHGQMLDLQEEDYLEIPQTRNENNSHRASKQNRKFQNID